MNLLYMVEAFELRIKNRRKTNLQAFLLALTEQSHVMSWLTHCAPLLRPEALLNPESALTLKTDITPAHSFYPCQRVGASQT